MIIGGLATRVTGRTSPLTVRVSSSAGEQAALPADRCAGRSGSRRGCSRARPSAGETFPWKSRRRGERQARPDGFPQPPQHLGVGRRVLRRDHRAVQRDQHAVGLGQLDAGHERIAEVLEELVRDRAGWRGPGHPEGNEVETVLCRTLDEPANLVVGVAPDRHHRRAVGEASFAEAVAGRSASAAKVFDSCINPPMAMRMASSLGPPAVLGRSNRFSVSCSMWLTVFLPLQLAR